VAWFGSVFALAVLAGSLASYAFHARAHYEGIDRALIVAVRAVTRDGAGESHFTHIAGQQGVALVLRVYENGRIQARTPGEAAPDVDPRAILARPAGPAYGFIPALAPSVVRRPQAGGTFGIIYDGKQRWRVYVERGGIGSAAGAAGNGAGPYDFSGGNGGTTAGTNGNGYVVAMAPLGPLDNSMAEYRVVLTGVGLGGSLVAILGIWLVAGRALSPIARLTETARAIAASRDLSRRVTATGRDELGLLATTFNEMLDSIETAYRLQQRFVADASHELRAPLTAILGNLDLLRRRRDIPEEERQEALEEAQREAARLSRLVADLLALARADAGMPLVLRPLDLDAVVLEAFKEARALSAEHEFVLEPFEPVRVAGDGDRLKQLLLILLDNAIKYTPSGGRITVGLRGDGDRAEITVRDTGVGIPPEDLPHVFERFYRADPARSRDPGGTGLGLPIARWIVEQHEGDITLESEPGRGTTVRVLLPRTA